MLHSLSKILHFTPLSEKKVSVQPHKLGLKRQMKKNTLTKKTCKVIKNKNDWGQSKVILAMCHLVSLPLL